MTDKKKNPELELPVESVEADPEEVIEFLLETLEEKETQYQRLTDENKSLKNLLSNKELELITLQEQHETLLNNQLTFEKELETAKDMAAQVQQTTKTIQLPFQTERKLAKWGYPKRP
jgi:hypothetical protein